MFKYPIAVTIDTNIFDSAKYDLSENSTLQLLKKYVNDGKIKVVLSDIVVRESKKHLAKQANKVCGIARKLRAEVLRESTEHFVNYIGLDRLLEIDKDKSVFIRKSEELFENFIKEIDAEILGTDLIDLDTIIDDYFEIKPPFEEGEKKRKEFPDAFIANQVRKRFGDAEDVAIISNDTGFKKACQQSPHHFFFDSLGALFDRISREQTEAYAETIKAIEEMQERIKYYVLQYVKDNENIELRGLSYDKDGVVSGFDYDEVYLNGISDVDFRVHSVDEMSGNLSIVTLLCEAKISADCYYQDYENAPWDSETKKHVFVDTIRIREEHNSRFGCRIEVDRKTKDLKLYPFIVILNGDTREDRYEINEEFTEDDEQEMRDIDRATLGFCPLGDYESKLEENLPNSDLAVDIIEQFEIINDLHRKFENFVISYDSLLGILNSSGHREIVKLISKRLKGILGFPNIIDIDNIEDNEIEEIQEWVNAQYEKVDEIASESRLPDVLCYGDSIVIKGIDGSEMVLTIDEIAINPTEGSEEIIGIRLLNNQGELARGYVKLIVGYLDFDEDGGAADGIADEIEYEYSEIIKEIKDYVSDQEKKFKQELKITEIIGEALGAKGE